MHQYEVGELYREGVTHYSEHTYFDFLQSGAILELYFNQPTSKEIEDITKGRFEIGFYETSGVIFMLFRFGRGPWMDAPYSVHLSKPFEFMELEPGMGYSLSVFLVDAATGILKWIRYIGLSTEFSRKFRMAVERQKEQPFGRAEYDAAINRIYANSSTLDLVKRADDWCRIK